MPVPAVPRIKQIAICLWRAAYTFTSCIGPRKKHRQIEPASLPAEIWDLILEYDIGRLLFVTKTASQLAKLDIQPREPLPSPRFTVSILDLTGLTIQVQLIEIGGRPYISNLSNLADNSGTGTDDGMKYLDLCGSNYLAVKSDGVGVVDIAFEKQQDGQPK